MFKFYIESIFTKMLQHIWDMYALNESILYRINFQVDHMIVAIPHIVTPLITIKEFLFIFIIWKMIWILIIK